jgi:hypothetical protein
VDPDLYDEVKEALADGELTRLGNALKPSVLVKEYGITYPEAGAILAALKSDGCDAVVTLGSSMHPRLDPPCLRVLMQNLHWQGVDVDKAYALARRGDPRIPSSAEAWDWPLPQGYLDSKDEILGYMRDGEVRKSLPTNSGAVTLLPPAIAASLTLEEREFLEECAKADGIEAVKEQWQLLLAQAKSVGHID